MILFALAFLLIGASSLIYQIVWIRLFQLIFGSTVSTTTAVIASFLLGYTLGSFYFSKRLQHAFRSLINATFFLGVYGLILFFISPFLGNISFFLSLPKVMKVFLVLLLLFPSTFILGGLWPFIHQLSIKKLDNIGQGSGILYSANSFGAMAGVLIAGFFLIPAYGFAATNFFAVALDIAAGILLISQKNNEAHHE